MVALTISSLNNGALDLDHIADFATTTAVTVTDRLGHTKRSLAGGNVKIDEIIGSVQATAIATLAALGYEPPVGYAAGINLTRTLQTVQFGENTYAPKYDFLPFITTGEFETEKFRVIQGLTSDDLAAPGASDGVGYGNRTLADRLSDQISVLRFDAVGNGVHDDLPAVLAAKEFSGRAHFPRVNDGLTTYYIGGFAAGLLDGLTISVDDGVALSFASNGPYALYKAIVFASNVRVYFRDILCWYVFQATPVPTRITPALSAPTSRRNNHALDCTKTTLVTPRINVWNTDDTFSVAPAVKTANSLAFGPTAQPVFRGGFVELGAYETVSAIFDDGTVPGPVGVIIRGTTGFTVIYSNGSSGNYYTATKLFDIAAAPAQANLAWPQLGQGTYTSFAPDRAIWSVSKMSATKAFVKLNGKALSAPFTEVVGDIQEVGFVCYGANAFTVSGFTLGRRTDAAVGMQELQLVLFGDSTAEAFPSYWGLDLGVLLNGLYGVRVAPIVNHAVAAQTLGQQFELMKTVGFGNAYYVVVCAGTNDAQGGTPLADWITLVAQVLNYIISHGRRPICMIPWLWYGLEQSGGTGQATARYDQAAPYRMVMERLAAERGAVILNLCEELPNPSPSLLQTDPMEPLLRDNIHQATDAQRLYAESVGRGLVDDYIAMPETVEERPSRSMMLSGSTASTDLRFVYGKNGMASLIGTIGVTAIGNETPVLRCPRHIAPAYSSNIGVIALSADQTPLGTCWLNIEPTLGIFRLSRAPVGTAVLILTGSTWQTAISKM